MAAINQHATVEKKAGECMFSQFLFPLFMVWLEFKAYGDGLNLRHMVMPHMYCEMQNKLSNTRGSPLGSMGEIISSRCPILFLQVDEFCCF